MTALSKPFTIGTTPGTVKPNVKKTPPKTASKTLPAKTIDAKTKPLVTAKVASKSSASKSARNVAASSPRESSAKAVVSQATPVQTAVESKTSKPVKVKKFKLVRDSFTIPKPEYLVLDALKLRAVNMQHPVKKGELLRAGIKALAAMTDSHLLTALQAVPTLKTGRPSK